MYPTADSAGKQKILIIGAGVFLVFLIIITFAITQLSRNQQSGTGTPTPTVAQTQPGQFTGSAANLPTQTKVSPPADGVIAKVGNELIYNVDLNTEVAAAPSSNDPKQRENIFAQMIEDSIILQGAAADKLITLDSTVFNSPTKDYAKRVALVQQAKQLVEENADSVSGSIVSIWFHNQQPGPIGYATGKQRAYNKIKPLYDQVKAGTMTMEQAGEAIRSDATLAEVDPAYAINSYMTFQSNSKQPPTFDPSFNKTLLALKPGQITDLTVVKDTDSQGKEIDAVYMFGKADSVITNKGYSDLESWLSKQRSKYEITRY